MSATTEPCGGCGEPDPKKACIGCLHFHASTTRETPDHIGEAANSHIRNLRLAGGRDFAVSGYSDGLIVEQDMRGMLLAAAEAFDALLSEIAALRGDLTETRVAADLLVSSVRADLGQAERQRDELRKALERYEAATDSVCATRSQETYLSMIDRDGASEALTNLDMARHEARTLLATQGADQ